MVLKGVVFKLVRGLPVIAPSTNDSGDEEMTIGKIASAHFGVIFLARSKA